MRHFRLGTHAVSALALSPDGRRLAGNVLHEGVFRLELAGWSEPQPLGKGNEVYNHSFVFEEGGLVSWVNTSGRFTFDPVSNKVHANPIGVGGSINSQIPLNGGRLLTGH